jgi:hypothetical protein
MTSTDGRVEEEQAFASVRFQSRADIRAATVNRTCTNRTRRHFVACLNNWAVLGCFLFFE